MSEWKPVLNLDEVESGRAFAWLFARTAPRDDLRKMAMAFENVRNAGDIAAVLNVEPDDLPAALGDYSPNARALTVTEAQAFAAQICVAAEGRVNLALQWPDKARLNWNGGYPRVIRSP